MQVQIRFKALGWNSSVGNFSAGDLVRVSPAMAAHLVDQAGAAEYVEPPASVSEAPAPAAAPADPAPARKRRGA